MVSKALSSLAGLLVAAAGSAEAGPCDYKPSILAGKAKSQIASGVRQGAALATDGAKAAGQYVLVHPASGLTLLGAASSGAGGAAAAVLGTVGTILTAPVTLTVGAVTFGAVGAYEGACYFSVERVTDETEVRRILEQVAQSDPMIRIVTEGGEDHLELVLNGDRQSYLVRKLYIADGVLRHRDWLLNTNLGTVAFVSPERDGATDAK